MPFDISGNYSRVHNWQEDRDNGIRILAQRMDEEDDSIAGALNQAFLRTGVVPMTGPLMMNGQHVSQVAAGTALQPGITFELDPDTGYFQPGIGQLGVAINGVQVGLWSDTGLNVNGINIGTGGGTIGDNIDIPGYITADGALTIGGQSSLGFTVITGVNNDPAMVELGANRTGDGAAIIDFHSTSGSDYNGRIVKGAGVAGALIMSVKGAASLILNSEDTGGNVIIQTLGQNRLAVWDNGNAQFYGSVDIDGVLGVDGTASIGGDLAAGSVQANSITLPRSGAVYQGVIYPESGSVIISSNRQVPGSERYFSFSSNGQLYINGSMAWHQGNDGAGSGLDADLLDGQHGSFYQTALGFTPVQNGTGIGQNVFNAVKIGWSPGNALRATVDNTDQGEFAMQSRDNNFGAVQAFWGSPTSIASHFNIWANGGVSTNGAITTTNLLQTTTAAAMVQFQHRDNSGITSGWYAEGNYARYWRSDLGDMYQIHPTAFRHNNDAYADCGGPSWRWNAVWCLSSTMQTSDAREKDWRGGLSPEELTVAAALGKEIGIYRWLRDIERDGDAAKLNCGWTAQRVIEVFNEHGLDAMAYAFVRYDTWEESTSMGPSSEPVTYTTVLGEDGEPLLNEAGEPTIIPHYPEGEQVVHPAGDRYSIMMADLIAFMLAAQEQRIAALEALVNP